MATIVQLQRNPSNLIQWKDSLANALYTEFGSHGHIVEFCRHATFKILVEKPDKTKIPDKFDLEVAYQEYAEARKLRVRAQHEYQMAFPKVFQKIMNSLSLECRDAVEQGLGFTALNQDKEPLKLFKAIISGTPNGDHFIPETARDIAMKRYADLAQGAAEPIAEYLHRFKSEVLYLQQIKQQDICGSVQMQTARFINSLLPTFEKLKVDLETAARADPNSYPKTLEDAYNKVSDYKRSAARLGPISAAVYAAEAERKEVPPLPREEPRKRKRRPAAGQRSQSDSSRSPSPEVRRSPSAEKRREIRHPCKLCQSMKHLTWQCPKIDDAVEALKLKKPEPEVPRKAEAYTVMSSGLVCNECKFPLGGGPPSCNSCDEIAADAMTPISRDTTQWSSKQSSTRLKHRPRGDTVDGWKYVGKSANHW